MELTSLITLAHSLGCDVVENAPMAQYTTFRVGGPADVLVTIPNGDAVAPILTHCLQQSIPYFWLGNGSNLLVGDGGIRGAVLRLNPHTATIRPLDDTTMVVDAGLMLRQACLYARDRSLTGLEFAYGIPGTIGGAVYMNAGAYDGTMADIVTAVEAVTYQGERLVLSADDMAMTYRHTALMEYPAGQSPIVVRVTLHLHSGDKNAIAARMKDLLSRRQEKQPLEHPSAGSFFKRPTGYYAGALIEQAGLKGYRVGDAQVSEKHAGFVVNRGNATAKDLHRLCADVQAVILEKTGIRLEPEVRFIGEE